MTAQAQNCFFERPQNERRNVPRNTPIEPLIAA